MKVVYIGAFRFPKYDAAASRVLNIGRTLRELGHEVIFIPWGGKYSENYVDSSGGDVYDNFRYYISGELNETKVWNKFKNKFRGGAQSINILTELINSVDVVISYNPEFNFNNKLVKLCRKYDVKYAVDLTEWYDRNELKVSDYIPNWLNMTRINRTNVKNRILISSFLQNYYPEGNNVLIPITCNSKDAKWNNKNISNKNPEIIQLIYAGTPAKKDKLHEIINAVEKIENKYPGRIVLNVLGIDRTTYLKRYKGLLENINISDAIQFKGRVSQDEVPSYYAHSDFMVLLRDSTRKSNAGFPTKFAESMMSGTPVIANLTSDLDRYLIDGYNGYIVDSPTSDSLYEVLFSKVMNIDSQKLEQMHEKAKKTGIDSFDYRGYVTSLSDFINNLL